MPALFLGIPTSVAQTTLFVLGITAYICMMLAENDKQQQNLTRASVVNGQPECFYGKDPSPTLSAVAVACTFIMGVAANFFAGVPFIFGTMRVFTLWHRSLVFLWFFIAWAGCLTSVIIGSYISWQQATHHRNASQNIDTAYDYTATESFWYNNFGAPPPADQLNPTGILCPAVKTGLFAGIGFVMIGNTAMWMGFIFMSEVTRKEAEIEETGGYKMGGNVATDGTPVAQYNQAPQ